MTWGDKTVMYVIVIALMEQLQVSWWWILVLGFSHIFLDLMEEEYIEDERKKMLKKQEPSEN